MLLLLLSLCAAWAAAPAALHAQDGARLRLGLGGVGGGFVGATPSGMGGLSARVGVQFNDAFAVYLQGHGLIGRFTDDPTRQAAGFLFNALMFEFTIDDIFQIGGGPALDFVWGCDESHQQACTGNGPYWGADVRLALLPFARHRGRRAGIAFSFDIIPVWFGSDASVALLGGVGFELY